MIRQRALAWAAVLALVATVTITPRSVPFSATVTSALAQDDSAADAGEPTDLAVAALHCAEAPATEALTAFFTTGAAPSQCAPAVGVTILVSENGAPVPGSPFRTDTAGTVMLPVSLGSAVEVSEDPASLPAGYDPLTQEANGVPYANPVQIDAAVAGAAVLFVNVPRSAATELVQDPPGAEAGEPTDLPVVALLCADAPEAETLTSFFSSGTPPSGCEPAVGVSVAVIENESPLAGSPFTTDADGILAVPVGLGAAVSVKEDPKSLPSGYEPLTHSANAVPYANPVHIDSATVDAAVLFVNVPSSVAARLAGDTLEVGGGATNQARAGTEDRTGCDPAYPDERTCIAPGRPLAAPCSITDQRNFTVLAPDPRGLDADHDGIGCEPIPPSGGAIARAPNVSLYNSGGNVRRAAPESSGDVPAAASRVRSDAGERVPAPENNRAGLWFVVPTRTSNVAIVSNPFFIANGVWGWPNRFSRDDWIWRSRNHHQDGVRFWPSAINPGNVTVAGSGSGNVAIASNPVFISNGVWAWPEHSHDDFWLWRNRFGNGAWFWPNRFTIGTVTIAGSGNGNGNGNVAIVNNPIIITSGVWHWPGHIKNGGWFWNHGMNNGRWPWPNHFGNRVWGWPRTSSAGNLVIARSGDNIAIVSNSIVIISGGLWFVPPDRDHDHDWFDRSGRDNSDGNYGSRDHTDTQREYGGSAQTDRSDAEAQAIDGGIASAATPSKIEPLAASEQSTLTVNGELTVEPAPADSMQPPSDGAVEPPVELDLLASEGADPAPLDTTVQTPAGAGAPDASYVAPDPNTIDSGSANAGDDNAGYVVSDSGGDPAYTAPDPAFDPGYVDPSYVEQQPDGVAPEPVYVEPNYVDPAYVAPETVYAEPNYADPDPVTPETVYVEPNYIAPATAAPEPVYVDPGYSATQPSYVEPGVDANFGSPEPNYVAPEPSYVAPDPSFVDVGNGAANPGMDAEFVDAGNAGAGNMAQDPGMDVAGNDDAGGGGDSGRRKGRHNND